MDPKHFRETEAKSDKNGHLEIEPDAKNIASKSKEDLARVVFPAEIEYFGAFHSSYLNENLEPGKKRQINNTFRPIMSIFQLT